MDFQLTVLTVTQKITTKPSGNEEQAPWSNLLNRTIPLSDATLSRITVSDDDNLFESGRYSPEETAQNLVSAFTFGNDPYPTPAGTQISFHLSTLIESQTPNDLGGFDQFRALFPRTLVSDAHGTELGGRFAVLIIPLPRADGTYPVFSLSDSYTAIRVGSFGMNNPSLAYPKVACFGAGTLIATATGLRPVETLRAGDLVLTRDHELQVTRWVGGSHVSAEGLEMRANLRPILIRRGALGQNSPERDLVVSPQHRVLIQSRIAHRLFEENELLVAAKHLVGLPGIEVTVPQDGITYFHLLFDRHEILLSDGAWTESLFTGPHALAAITDAARREILTLFPELASGQTTPPARRLLNGREARQLAERQRRNIGKRKLVEPV